MRLPADYLVIFAVTMEEGSVSKAAGRLYLAQSTVSGHLKSLSEIVGEPLYRRMQDKLIPTHTGEALLGHAQAVARSLEGTVEFIRNVRSLSTGQLRLGLSSTPAAFHWPQLMSAFRQKHPQLQFQVHSGSLAEVLQSLERREVDMALVAGEPDHLPSGLEKDLLCHEEMLLILPPWHPWSFRGAVTVKEIKGLNVIMRQKPSYSQSHLEKALEKSQIGVKMVLELASHEAMKEAVALGLGIAFLPAPVVKRDVASGFIAALRIQGLNLERPYYLLRPPLKLLSHVAKYAHGDILHYFKQTSETTS
ncbi:MAG: LysR family transcriptional regulator [Deinococcales bacterium]